MIGHDTLLLIDKKGYMVPYNVNLCCSTTGQNRVHDRIGHKRVYGRILAR